MLSFYVHIPYCVRRCGYCDFNTYTPSELQDGATLEIVSGDYIDAVLKELEFAPKDEVVPTIFFGGGTPSLLPPKDLGRVITAIKERYSVTEDCEITLEANPDSVTKEKLEQLIAAGFNRISFGMQSSNPEVLKVLDRTHNPDNVRKAVEMAREAGFSSISVDLIYGAPGETGYDDCKFGGVCTNFRNPMTTPLKQMTGAGDLTRGAPEGDGWRVHDKSPLMRITGSFSASARR